MQKRAIALVAALIALACWAKPTSAAVFKAGDSILLPKDFITTQDVYAASQDLNAQGTFNGDLISAGMNERITGNVKGSVMVAGMYVDVLGNVGRSLRAAGNKVVIGGTVEGDVIVGGAFVQILPDAVIKGDLVVGAGNASIDGKVLGNAKISGGSVIVNGTINGENKFTVQDQLIIGPAARFAKKLNYNCIKEATIDPQAALLQGSQFIKLQMQEKNREEIVRAKPQISFGIIFFGWLIKLLVMLATALVALHFFKKQILSVSKDVLDRFAGNLGWGLVWAIVAPIACVILLITVIGSVLGMVGFVVYALSWFLACILAEIIVGIWLRKLVTKTFELDWKTVLIGVVVFQTVALIPVLGWIACWIFILAAMGGVVAALKNTAK